MDECTKLNLTPITSVTTFNHADHLWKAGFRYIKIGSAQATDGMLIRKYRSLGFNVMVSTGGHEYHEIPQLQGLACLFHCVSKYPHKPQESNLLKILDIRKRWPCTPTGFSSHVDPLSKHWALPLVLALTLGASYLEVHYTDLPRDATRDGKVSLDFAQLQKVCAFDRMSPEDRLSSSPWLGMFRHPMSQGERELIARYTNRFKRDV